MTADLGPESTLAVVAEAVSKTLPEDDWDLAPQLGIILADGPLVTVQGFPLPERVWEGKHPIEVINWLTVLMIADPLSPPPDGHGDPVGILACIEGYAATIPPGTPVEEVQAFERWCDSHSIADHPWGRESRDIYAVGFDGSLHHVNHLRGSTCHHTDSYRYLDDWPTGRLIDALKEFTAATRRAVT